LNEKINGEENLIDAMSALCDEAEIVGTPTFHIN
jgi:hypothetical protein